VTLIEITFGRPTQVVPRQFERSELCETIERAVATRLAVPLEDMRSASRGRATVAFARQIAMYLAHVVMSLNYSETGRMFRRDRTTAVYACRLIEDRRDHPATDALLQSLETALSSNIKTMGWRQ